MALPIWADFMGKITDQKGEEPFVRPPGIVEETVCLRLRDAGHQRLRLHRPRRSSCPTTSRRTSATCTAAQLHDFKGVDKDFETLDRDDDEF